MEVARHFPEQRPRQAVHRVPPSPATSRPTSPFPFFPVLNINTMTARPDPDPRWTYMDAGFFSFYVDEHGTPVSAPCKHGAQPPATGAAPPRGPAVQPPATRAAAPPRAPAVQPPATRDSPWVPEAAGVDADDTNSRRTVEGPPRLSFLSFFQTQIVDPVVCFLCTLPRSHEYDLIGPVGSDTPQGDATGEETAP